MQLIKVLDWFTNHISQLNEQLGNCESWEAEELQAELETALKMKFIVSSQIPTREEWEEDEEFCHDCDWHGSCQAHPKE